MLPTSIRTERLRLRPLVVEDASAVHAALADWEVMRWLLTPLHPGTPEDIKAMIARQADIAGPGGRFYAIDDGSGLIGALGIIRRNGAMNLGYWLARAHWGLGYIGEAATAVVDAFFENRPEILLVSGVIEGDVASLRMQEQLGFVPVAETTPFSRVLGKRVPHVTTWLGRPRWRDMKDRRETLAAAIAGMESAAPTRPELGL